MMLSHDTYHRSIQLKASQRRLEDAQALLREQRWIGAMYLGGYAVECAFVALICYYESKTNFKDTRAFKLGVTGGTIHRLSRLLSFAGQGVQNAIQLDITGKLKKAWDIVSQHWQYEKLRYHDKVGNEPEAREFLEAVQILHSFLLRQQGE
jgi:hypothetical protein